MLPLQAVIGEVDPLRLRGMEEAEVEEAAAVVVEVVEVEEVVVEVE